MTCNKTGYAVDSSPLYTIYEVWLSEGNIDDLNAMFDIGAGASALADALVAWGVLEASTPPGIGTAIAGVLLIEKGLINYYADGCGVKITIYMINIPTVAFETIESQ